MNNNFNTEKLHVNHIALFAVDGAFGLRENNILIGGFDLVSVIGSDDYFVKCEDVRAKMHEEDFRELETTCTTYFIDRRLVVGCSECNDDIRGAWSVLYGFAARHFNASRREIYNACVNTLLDDDKRKAFLDFIAVEQQLEKLQLHTRHTYDLCQVRTQDSELIQDIGAAIDRFDESLNDIHHKKLDFFFDLFSIDEKIERLPDANTVERF